MTLAPPSCVSSTDNTYQKAGAFVDPLDPPDVNQSPAEQETDRNVKTIIADLADIRQRTAEIERVLKEVG